MVGEIRDLETADIAIKAAQTGHMVFSTLHTNDAPSTLTRLMNMGVAPFNIASSVILITAQRLARRLCTCKQPLETTPRSAARGRLPRDELDGSWKPYGPVGCDRCLRRRLQGPGRHLPDHADHAGDRDASSSPTATRWRSRPRPRRKA